MSHSRIFQTANHPIDEEDLVEEEKYFDSNAIPCDYVSASDAQSDLQWLKECYPDYLTVDVQAKSLIVKDARKYKADRFRNIATKAKELHDLAKEAADNIEGENEDAYDGTYKVGQDKPSVDNLVYRIQSMFSDQGGFWVDDEYYGIMPMNEWLSNLAEGDVVYVGNTFDYHY